MVNIAKLISSFLFLFGIIILFHIKSPSSEFSSTWAFFHSNDAVDTMVEKLRDSITWLPLKDIRFVDSAMTGHTWFMSSLNDTHEQNEAEHLYFPSEKSNNRLLCIKGKNTNDGTKNSYALAWPESLPESAILLKGLTFVSYTYYNHQNLWHGLCATAPFVRWAMKNQCSKPTRWVLYHWGELRFKMGSWVSNLTKANFGEIKVEVFDQGDGPYCFEKAVVMRHDLGSMGMENKLKVFDLLRCKARSFCGINSGGRGIEVNGKGVPIIRLTLLMRRNSRSFKNASAVTDIFAKECERVEGCVINVVQSDDLSFCEQVKVTTHTDIVASPHGAQLTNMLFMDRNSSVMEFFPKGWLEHAGIGQYAYHWMADQSGMKHRGAWWDPIGDDCPSPNDDLQCFLFHKDGKVGHNATLFAEWTKKVLDEMRLIKLEQATRNQVKKPQLDLDICVC